MPEEVTPQLVLHGYSVGIFPMADDDGSLRWYSPDPRCVLEFETFHVPRSLRQIIRHSRFEVRFDTAFERVIAACRERPEGTWISQKVVQLYTDLHRAGHAHSVESWQEDRLVGGLYGVTLGGAFFGESMFHRVSDASKVALVALMERLQQQGYVLVDTQWITPHLARFGAVEIGREEYLQRLADAVALDCRFDDLPHKTTGA